MTINGVPFTRYDRSMLAVATFRDVPSSMTKSASRKASFAFLNGSDGYSSPKNVKSGFRMPPQWLQCGTSPLENMSSNMDMEDKDIYLYFSVKQQILKLLSYFSFLFISLYV